jgi:CheY-like chemotaxis protein
MGGGEGASVGAVDLFYSYAHEDESLRDELDTHLALLKRRGVLRTWHDRQITPGGDWRQTIDTHLVEADIVLLLVSADFMNSDYINDREMQLALQRHRAGLTVAVPVMVRAVDWEGAPFADLQGLPTDMKPVTSWANRDEAWTDVAKGIRRAIARLASSRPVSPPAAADLESVPAPSPTAGGTGAPPSTAMEAEQRALSVFGDRLREAYAARGLPTPPDLATESGRLGAALIAVQEPKRILWVDDNPENNRSEIAALLRLQIEVTTRRSTEEALEALTSAAEPYDLVISDWQRATWRRLFGAEGLRLLAAMRAGGITLPVLFYHGESDPEKAARRAREAVEHGAAGATNAPDVLLRRVAELLTQS